MLILRIISLTFFLFLSAAPSNAKTLSTGAEFLRACDAVAKQADGVKVSSQEQAESIYCVAYLSGFTDSVRLSSHYYEPKAQKICLPVDGVSNEQLARVVTKWLRGHPETLRHSVRIEILLAFESAFPCQ